MLRPRTLAASIVFVLLTACSTGPARAQTDLVVAGAASLNAVFPQLAAGFERAHPGIHVRFTFSSSNGLATSIKEGAPVDVFASASPKWIDAIATDPGVLQRAIFARNRLVLIVPKDNPAHIAKFADIARAGVRLVVAAVGVPAGDYARQAFSRAGLDAALHNIVSNEQDVEGVVQKVVSGDADAGIAYATDLTAPVAQSVKAFELPANANVVAKYEIAVILGSKVSAEARAFVAYVLGAGQALLRQAGFSPPA